MDNQPQSQEINLRKGPGRVQSSNLLDRIWKYKLHYIIVLPAMIFILIFKIIPFISAGYLSFTDYSFFRGIFNSPWVGTENFRNLFSDPGFISALSNTMIIKLSYIAASGITALVVALLVSMIASRRLRNLFSTLFLVPFFIPAAVFAYLALLILSPDHSPILQMDAFVWVDPDHFRPLLVATEVIKSCGIPIIIALAAISAKRNSFLRIDMEEGKGGKRSFVYSHIIPALKAITAFMLIQFSTLLSPDFELVSQLVNPLVQNVGDTLDTYYYKSVFVNAQFGHAGVLWIIQFVVQLLFTLLAYLLIRGLFVKDVFSPVEGEARQQVTNKGRNLAGIVGSLVCSVVVLLFIYVLFVYPFTGKSTSERGLGDLFSAYTFFIHGGFDFAAVIINLLITLTLAYPLTVKDLPGRSFYKVFLLFIMTMGSSIALQDYLMVKNLEMVNTIFPLTINGFISILNVFVLKSIFNSKHSALKEQASAEGRGEFHAFFTLFIPKVWKPLVAMGVLQFVALWNSYYSSLLYTSDVNRFSPIMKFVALVTRNPGDTRPSLAVILEYGAIVSIPSILLLLLFRRWLTAEVLIGQSRKL
ncbi:hypothetical protein Back11_08800 [Paenibacillus baekrokdamisoli]|uniref:Uncharacterized protein n=1 Tax=Paenibacillus baekrokdamisoli TaxID=1712516 RepID=A0A3G9IU17_9BACL|nr:hypothetical protein [Paenibacillus baekrokdamisoli]MBB3067276.1 ABC-type polysaccharide transport system permease subunit/ABC-type maltose transport system permease subunit [Paenibacillus baekrokdamisoli]BBH19535.1 hypothetical protein Back11_08800 [Paenibacillus baekrokdamisoli]